MLHVGWLLPPNLRNQDKQPVRHFVPGLGVDDRHENRVAAGHCAHNSIGLEPVESERHSLRFSRWRLQDQQVVTGGGDRHQATSDPLFEGISGG